MKNFIKIILFSAFFAVQTTQAFNVPFSGLFKGASQVGQGLKLAWENRGMIVPGANALLEHKEKLEKAVKVIGFFNSLGALKGSILVACVLWLVYACVVLIKQALSWLFKFLISPLSGSIDLAKTIIGFILTSGLPIFLAVGGTIGNHILNRAIDGVLLRVPVVGPILVPARQS